MAKPILSSSIPPTQTAEQSAEPSLSMLLNRCDLFTTVEDFEKADPHRLQSTLNRIFKLSGGIGVILQIAVGNSMSKDNAGSDDFSEAQQICDTSIQSLLFMAATASEMICDDIAEIEASACKMKGGQA